MTTASSDICGACTGQARERALRELSVRAFAQAHAWFKRDHPENLDLNKVNAPYLELSSSRVSPDFAERSQAVIERIIKAVVDQGAAREKSAAPMTDNDLDDLIHEEW